MDQKRYTVSRFSHVGFFSCRHEVKIERVGDRYQGTVFEMLADEPKRTFNVSD